MEKRTKISVAIAAWQGERFIAEQLRSLFRQTRRVDEIVIGDDSPDNRMEQVIRQASKEWNGKLKYIKNPVRLGIEKNFLNAVRESSGDIIFLCDQDDVWLSEKVEILAGELEKHPYCQVAACNSEMVDADLNPIHETIPANLKEAAPVFQAINNRNAFPYMISLKMIIPGHAMAMKRSFKPFFLRMPETLKYHDVWLEQTAAFFEVMRYVDKILTLYRVHGNNASTPLERKNKQDSLLRLKEVMQTNNDIAQTLSVFMTLRACADHAPFPVPEKNLNPLNTNIRYFQARKKLRSRRRPFRFLALTPTLLRDYFHIGTGWRAFLRDQLL